MSFVSVCLGMVPLPDTAIDFSDLRSQSSRMNERVSRKNTEIFVILLMRHAHLHKLKAVSGEWVWGRFLQFSSVTGSTESVTTASDAFGLLEKSSVWFRGESRQDRAGRRRHRWRPLAREKNVILTRAEAEITEPAGWKTSSAWKWYHATASREIWYFWWCRGNTGQCFIEAC